MKFTISQMFIIVHLPLIVLRLGNSPNGSSWRFCAIYDYKWPGIFDGEPVFSCRRDFASPLLPLPPIPHPSYPDPRSKLFMKYGVSPFNLGVGG